MGNLFYRIVFGVPAMTIAFVIHASPWTIDEEVKRVLALKGVRTDGEINYTIEPVECPTGEWSSERWEAIRQLELEYNIYLHSLNKDDCDVATTELEDPLILTPERWMKLRAEMHANKSGLCGDDGQESRYIQDVYENMVKLEKRDRDLGY
jgi:hypothetical protein